MQKVCSFSNTASKGLLHRMMIKGFSDRRLQIYEGNRHSISGIRATIFGATGFLGPYIGAILGYISSDVIFPHCHKYPYDDEVKELKLCASLGQSWIVRHLIFEDDKMLDRCIANSNVVINLVGPRKNIRKIQDYEYANVTIPTKIAEAVKRNPNITRFIHFSAVGADLQSPSMDLRTKFHGEEAVKDIIPWTTIVRPATIFGFNDYFTRLIMTQREFFYHFNIVTDDCSAKRQPVYVHDIAQAVLNILKMPETVGKTYELGGPHVYSMLEIYEIMFNILQRQPKLIYFPYELATKVAQHFKNWEFFNYDYMVKGKLDMIVSPDANTFKDLYIQPVSFPQGVEKYISDSKFRSPGRKDELER